MRVRRQADSARQFTSEVQQVVFGEATFDEGSRVDAGRRVTLEVDLVSGVFRCAGVKEVVESDFVKRCGTGVSRNVAADSDVIAVGSHNHCHRVPANDALNASFRVTIARERRFIFNGN